VVFLRAGTPGIPALGLAAFALGTAGGLLPAKLMNRVSRDPINPLIGAAGASAVPMPRVGNGVGLEANADSPLLTHAVGPNGEGVIAWAVAAGVFLTLLGQRAVVGGLFAVRCSLFAVRCSLFATDTSRFAVSSVPGGHMRARALALCALFALTAACAGAPDQDPIDRLVEAALAEYHIPGAALAIVQDGMPVKLAGYGVASLEHGVPVQPGTVFEIGSLTKTFTAVAVLLLADEGRVDLDDPVCRHVTTVPEPWCAATVRHLLTHTSGIANKTDGTLDDFLRMSRDTFTPQQVFALIGEELESAPGERMAYNNTGYYLLGMIVAEASGQDY
jgi:hypothetical protein